MNHFKQEVEKVNPKANVMPHTPHSLIFPASYCYNTKDQWYYSATGITLKSFWDSGKQKEKPKWNLIGRKKYGRGFESRKIQHFFVVELV